MFKKNYLKFGHTLKYLKTMLVRWKEEYWGNKMKWEHIASCYSFCRCLSDPFSFSIIIMLFNRLWRLTNGVRKKEISIFLGAFCVKNLQIFVERVRKRKRWSFGMRGDKKIWLHWKRGIFMDFSQRSLG